MNKMYDDLGEYKKAVLSDSITPSEIMKEITLPQSVYKYRKFDTHPEYLQELEKYKKSLQGALRVGCFTTCDCSQIGMWDNQHFGDKHKGYCIEYKVEPTYFYPNTIIFLKILYDNYGFDATDAIKNFVSPLMQAIYLGSEFRKTDKNGEMYEHALRVCKKHHIPLYIMRKNGDKLEENIEYNPKEE